MAPLTWLLLVTLDRAAASADVAVVVSADGQVVERGDQGAAASEKAEVVVSDDGKVEASGKGRQSMVRRHDDEVIPAELTQRGASQQFYGVMDESDREQKIKQGTTYKSSGKNGPSFDPPAWAPHHTMPSMPSCVKDVSQDMGLSDYGSTSHTCTSCARNCTEHNMQKDASIGFLIEPALSDCNAFDVKFYANWSSVDQLGCRDCTGKGLRHKFEFEIASNAGDAVQGTAAKDLHFDGWMGPEIYGGLRSAGSAFLGKHIFEIADTVEPSHSENCNRPNSPGRWYAIPGGVKAGESFHCERICDSAHNPCHCDRKSRTRCESVIAMSSKQVFTYRIRKVSDSATGTLLGNSYVGTEWEVTAEDLHASSSTPLMVVGRIILQGNAPVYGIKSLSQAHQHIGCTPCDLFYESTIAAGPFINDPPEAHVVRSADGRPPPLTVESCELFRISSMGGYAVQFETGPGVWPAAEVGNTIFTCSHIPKNTCPV